jgi:hypothetical protein
MKNILIKPTLDWIYNDFKSNRYRFAMELVAWALSIGCAIIMAGTVPNPPLVVVYPAWIAGCTIYAWCGWSRRSFGMLVNYLLLVSIDIFGFIRLLTTG